MFWISNGLQGDPHGLFRTDEEAPGGGGEVVQIGQRGPQLPVGITDTPNSKRTMARIASSSLEVQRTLGWTPASRMTRVMS